VEQRVVLLELAQLEMLAAVVCMVVVVVVLGIAAVQELPVWVKMAQFVLFGLATLDHFHQLAQGICNELVHTN
jgi:hypothetical protein